MKKLAIAVCMVALLGGCASNDVRPTDKEIREKADYWQRSEDVSALYLTGPKAQHQLNMDIAACVAEVKELVRLGSIRNAQPPKDLALEPGLQRGWDSPTRDGPLYTEYTDFQDFDGCMKHKGWERMDYVHPAEARAAAGNYSQTILGHELGWTPPANTTANDHFNN
jgi:hypothetical protein